MKNESKFTFIDLFAGIGGFRLALEELKGECVFSSEIDEKARETYFANFGEVPHGDIREITGPDKNDRIIDIMIPDHEILTGGFPCQPFSLAGVSSRNSLGLEHGLLDKSKGTLFFDICRIVKVKRPRVIFLENVSNIVGHDKGRTFAVIEDTIREELGYSFFYKVLSSETLVPQKRKRCFFVAFRDEVTSFDFPELSGDPMPLRMALETNVDPKYTLSDKGWAGHQRRTKNNLARGTGFTAFEANLDKPANTLVARYYKDGKECLVPQEGRNPRMLTPRECARLQGFPEIFQPHPTRTSAYKQFGNAVPVPVVGRVAQSILHKLEEIENGGPSFKDRQVQEHVCYKGKKYKARISRQKPAA